PPGRHPGAGRPLHAAQHRGDAGLSARDARAGTGGSASCALALLACRARLRFHHQLDGDLLHLPRLHADLRAEVPAHRPHQLALVEYDRRDSAHGGNPPHGASLRPLRPQAFPAPLLCRLHRAAVPDLRHDAVGRVAHYLRPGADRDRPHDLALLRPGPGGDLGDFPDAGALDLDDERLCARGCDLRRLCALHRHLAHRRDRQPDITGLLRDRGGAGECRRHRLPEGDRARAARLSASPVERFPRDFSVEGVMNVQAPALEPWQWPEEHWRKLVGRVRAGRALRPKAWKDGARCAVALSFDSDHETNELRDGGKSIGRLCWGQYGNRVGVPRILKILEKHGVKATFYVPAVSALIYPDEQRRVVAEGHEIGIHGWIHELNSVLPYDAERDLMLRSADTLEKVSGVRPIGLRTPSWDFSPNTLRIEKEMGLAYDSSLMSDEDCYELVMDGEPTGIVELPVEWVRDDAVFFMMHRFSSSGPTRRPRTSSRSSAASSTRPTR